MVTDLFVFLFLITGTIFDLKSRSVPLIVFPIFGIPGICLSLIIGQLKTGQILDWAFGILLGLVFIAISLISDKKLGMGDAFAILVTGIYLGGCAASAVLMYAMMAASILSIIILAMKKASGKTELPFIPFLLLGCIIQQIWSNT